MILAKVGYTLICNVNTPLPLFPNQLEINIVHSEHIELPPTYFPKLPAIRKNNHHRSIIDLINY